LAVILYVRGADIERCRNRTEWAGFTYTRTYIARNEINNFKPKRERDNDNLIPETFDSTN